METKMAFALCGMGPIVGANGKPSIRNRKGWKAYAKREAAKKSKREHFVWTGFCAWIPQRGCYRISFAGDKRKGN
ncbi:MAG: hypothetical protein WC143_08365 [Eubacteriales bacterium]